MVITVVVMFSGFVGVAAFSEHAELTTLAGYPCTCDGVVIVTGVRFYTYCLLAGITRSWPKTIVCP